MIITLFLKGNGAIFHDNNQNNTWMLGNMKFMSHVDKDTTLVGFAHS